MNDEQLEQVCRLLCKARGIDPDVMVMHGADDFGGGATCDICLYSPAWTRIKSEIVAFHEIKTIFARLGL